MKFIYSDNQDYVDPDYDFATDTFKPGRERYWDDRYAHELMAPAPYDGVLVSMSLVRQASNVAVSKVRYSTKEEQRLLRDGVRRFLRLDGDRFRDMMLVGDCGAFAMTESSQTAFAPEEVVEFYAEAEFTHGVSPDLIIFECDLSNPTLEDYKEEVRSRIKQRFELTLHNAEVFYELARTEGFPFVPMGAVQGWSPESLGQAARQLEAMGFEYLAVGGLVPLKPEAIKVVLRHIRSNIRSTTKLHLLGFAKADNIHEFKDFGITSFDSSSPMVRAFRDDRANFFVDVGRPALEYFSAIRIPQAIENPSLMQGVKRGLFRAEELHDHEQAALETLRRFDRGEATLRAAVDAVLAYATFLGKAKSGEVATQEKVLAKTERDLERTLSAAPWRLCGCEICTAIGIDVIIFRGSNRNKRRGMHNLGVYYRHLQRTLETEA